MSLLQLHMKLLTSDNAIGQTTVIVRVDTERNPACRGFADEERVVPGKLHRVHFEGPAIRCCVWPDPDVLGTNAEIDLATRSGLQ
tara:strand:+ start:1836 stop:2090 length:255 start_codon:yes stop_codon:yes gene_type:complete